MWARTLLVLSLLGLPGCALFRSQNQSETHEVTQVTGQVDGKQVNLTLDKQSQSRGTSSTSLDTSTAMGWASLILNSLGGSTGIMAIILAFREKSRADEHKADADNAGKTWTPKA